MISTPIFIFALIELLAVAYGDFKTRKISNYWSILNIIVYAILIFLVPNEYSLSGMVLLNSLLFLIIGFVLFLFKVMGGGDAKFLATFVLLVPLNLHNTYLLYLLEGTILFAFFFFIKSIIMNFKDISMHLMSFDFKGVKIYFGSKFPFAPVILFTWLILGWEIRKSLF